MFRRTTFCALAAAAMMTTTGALAQHGHGAGGSAGAMDRGSGMGPGNAMPGLGNSGMGNAGMSNIGVQTRDSARVNSQGPANASANGIAHANSNSVLAGPGGTGTNLNGLTSGMALMRNGTQIGTVTRVVTNHHGVIVRVMVRGTDGRTLSLSPSSLSLSGGVLTTTTATTHHM